LRSKNLRYVEGYAIHPEQDLLFHHAWTVDDSNIVVDPTLCKEDEPTLSTADQYQYFGVRFTKTDIDEFWNFDLPFLARLPFIKDRDPGVAN
jgi:hypothetical protein